MKLNDGGGLGERTTTVNNVSILETYKDYIQISFGVYKERRLSGSSTLKYELTHSSSNPVLYQ